KAPPSEAEIIHGIHTLIEVGALTARSHLAKVDEEKRVPKRAVQPALIREAVAYYKTHLDRIQEPFARALAQEATAFFETPIERHLESDPLQARALANGALISQPMLVAAVEPARDLYNTLRERLSRKNLTHCYLAEKVSRLPPPKYEKTELH